MLDKVLKPDMKGCLYALPYAGESIVLVYGCAGVVYGTFLTHTYMR